MRCNKMGATYVRERNVQLAIPTPKATASMPRIERSSVFFATMLAAADLA